jgi:predicted kinase
VSEKTILANELAPLINAVVLSTDKIRKELIEKPKRT